MSLCTQCEKRKKCVKLCRLAEKFAGIDNVNLKEVPISSNIIDSDIYLSSAWPETLPSQKLGRKKLIIDLYKDGLAANQIAYHLPCTARYIRRVIKDHVELKITTTF